MIDENFKVWLIEVNTNPCFELASPLLSKIIPQMLDNTFKLTIDSVFAPPVFYNIKKIHSEKLENNKFELIFDEEEEGPLLI